MVFQNKNIHDKYDLGNERFSAAFQFLKKEDIEKLPDGNYPIQGENVFAMIQSFETADVSERRLKPMTYTLISNFYWREKKG